MKHCMWQAAVPGADFPGSEPGPGHWWTAGALSAVVS